MKRKLIMAVFCALLLCALTGCKLAQENMGTGEVTQDRLIGMFITTEHLDLFDFESYLSDNLGNFTGGDVILEGDTQKYQGRLYATLKPKTMTDAETGRTVETEEYVFENMAGMAFLAPTVPATAEKESYTSSMYDEGITDVHTSHHFGDEKTGMTLEGTFYVTPAVNEHIYYFNPVYQSADGRVYATTGTGFIVHTESYGEYSIYTQTMDATTTVTENGKTKMDSTTIKLSISLMFAPEKIAVLQMDADSKLLSGMDYAPGAMPGTFVPDAATAYLIVETYKRDDTGSVKISRQIYGEDDQNIETFAARADGICVKHWTAIKWE